MVEDAASATAGRLLMFRRAGCARKTRFWADGNAAARRDFGKIESSNEDGKAAGRPRGADIRDRSAVREGDAVYQDQGYRSSAVRRGAVRGRHRPRRSRTYPSTPIER